jgi:hypothetical protein
MGDAWGGYSNGEIPYTAMRQVSGEWFEPDMADRMDYLLAACSAQGLTVRVNEGYRPLGVPSDRYVLNEWGTSTAGAPLYHGSNQWFQKGREDRGETPDAGTPGFSSHGWGVAADIQPGRNNGLVASVCAQLGLIFNVASESWHMVARGTPTVDYKPKDYTKKRKCDMVWVGCNANGGHWIVAPGFIRQTNWMNAGEAVTQAALGDIVVVETEAQLLNFFAILDISSDVYKALPSLPNRTWSRELEILDKIAKIPGSGGATVDQIATAVDKKLAPSFSAIPKTVNDDVAKRMSS